MGLCLRPAAICVFRRRAGKYKASRSSSIYSRAPNNINTRGYGGKVYVVVHPSKEPRIDEIRHAFLLHLLDPLSIRYAKEIGEKEILSRFALFAPALGEIYKRDFQLLVTKCLVKAVEARLARVSTAERQDRVQRDLREGLILTPYFYESLAKFEKQGQAMRYYYPQLIKGIDLKREAARLQEVKFAEAPYTAALPGDPAQGFGNRYPIA